LERLGNYKVNSVAIPAITILMPVYNGSKYLKESVESILTQTFTDFEFLIIDDGSTDSTPELLEELRLRDKRIRIVHKEHSGLTSTLNQGIRLARADVIARQDCDDTSLPKRLELCYNVLWSNKLDFVSSRAYWKRDGKTKIRPPRIYSRFLTRKMMKYGNLFIHGALMYKKKSVIDVGLYDESYSSAQDFDLTLKLLLRGPTKMIDIPLYVYNSQKDSISVSNSEEQNANFIKILNYHFNINNSIFFKKMITSERLIWKICKNGFRMMEVLKSFLRIERI